MLRLGDKGDEVRRWQQTLAALGYSIKVDGDFGPETERITKQFQQDYWVTGIADPFTTGLAKSADEENIRTRAKEEAEAEIARKQGESMKFNRAKFFDGYRNLYGSLNQEQVDGLESLLGFIEDDVELSDLRQITYVLATTYHETAHTFQPIHERGSSSYFEGRYGATTRVGKTLGNKLSGDGAKYHGRGYVQITGRLNYSYFAKRLNLDLLERPDDALQPRVAYQIMSIGMREGKFTGKKMDDYINEAECNYRQARRVVNGLDRADDIAKYARDFESILEGAKE